MPGKHRGEGEEPPKPFEYDTCQEKTPTDEILSADADKTAVDIKPIDEKDTDYSDDNRAIDGAEKPVPAFDPAEFQSKLKLAKEKEKEKEAEGAGLKIIKRSPLRPKSVVKPNEVMVEKATKEAVLTVERKPSQPATEEIKPPRRIRRIEELEIGTPVTDEEYPNATLQVRQPSATRTPERIEAILPKPKRNTWLEKLKFWKK